MREFCPELQFILHMLNPNSPPKQIEEKQFVNLNEDKLTEILKKNKLATKFSKKLDTQPIFKEKFMTRFPKISLLDKTLKESQKRDLEEFVRISRKLSIQDVHLLLIKSGGEFPYESSNIDCIINPDQLSATVNVLRDEGYHELVNSREPHKYLFRKTQAPRELPLHIHTRVEWEAVEFADAQNLRNRARPFLSEETGAFVPSVEDEILITIAHYFFEDHETKLYDLLKLWDLARQTQPEWSYMFSQAKNLGWTDALELNLQLINHMGSCCFGAEVFAQIPKAKTSTAQALASKIIKFNPNGLLKIPYGVSALFFAQKVVKNSHYGFSEKSRQIVYVFYDLLRRRMIGYIAL